MSDHWFCCSNSFKLFIKHPKFEENNNGFAYLFINESKTGTPCETKQFDFHNPLQSTIFLGNNHQLTTNFARWIPFLLPIGGYWSKSGSRKHWMVNSIPFGSLWILLVLWPCYGKLLMKIESMILMMIYLLKVLKMLIFHTVSYVIMWNHQRPHVTCLCD